MGAACLLALLPLWRAGDASAQTADLPTLYAVPGVRSTGLFGLKTIATTFFCSNSSGGEVALRLAILDFDGVPAGEITIGALPHGRTIALSTRPTALYEEDAITSLDRDINQGLAIIEASSPLVFCSAVTLDAAASPPAFSVGLHMVRINPVPGTKE